MKKKINTRILIIVTLALVIFASFSVILMNFCIKRFETENSRFFTGLLIDEIAAGEDMRSTLSALFKRDTIESDTRITVFRKDGELIDDNKGGAPGSVSNEKLLRNIRDALNGSFEPYLLRSDTFKSDAVVNFERFNYQGEDYVICTVIKLPDLINYTLLLIPIALLVLIFTSFTVVRLMSAMINGVSEPLKAAGNVIENMSREQYRLLKVSSNFEEVESLITKLNYYNNKQLNANTLNLSNKRKINFVIEELSVGVVAFDENDRILLSNNFALSIFGATKNIIGGDIKEFFNDEQLLNKIKAKIGEKSGTAFTYRVNERVFRVEIIIISPAESLKKDAAVIFTDITAESMLDAMRSEFFANASHELKTPITAILGFSELLLLRADLEEIRPLIENIQRNSRKMYELIQDMMELSRLDANLSREAESVVDLRDLAEFALSSLSPLANESNIRFRVRGRVFVRARHKQMEQLLTNLISNAVKYNVAGGKVYVELGNDGENAFIRVRDSGRGIPQGDLPRVFERFFCVDKGRTRSSNSTGLGLAIVKEIVAQHNGRIILESVYGTGTQFTVLLPQIAEGQGEAEYEDDEFETESSDIFGSENDSKLRRIDDVVSIRERVD